MRKTRFWYNLHNVLPVKRLENQINLWEKKKPITTLTGLPKSAIVTYLCLGENNHSFYNNYIIQELHIWIINISNKPCQCRNTDYWSDDTFQSDWQIQSSNQVVFSRDICSKIFSSAFPINFFLTKLFLCLW